MKHPTLQKITLAVVALVVSVAVSARASRSSITSVKQTHRDNSSIKWNGTLFPASTYMLDDGTADDAIGLTLGGDIICLNKFAVIPGSETITSISIAWGTPVFFDPSLDGLPYTAALWNDPNGDGDPTDAQLLATAAGVVADQGTDTFITSDIPDTTVTTTNFFVGFVITHSGGQFPCAFDETDPTFFNTSYTAFDTIPGSADIEDLTDNEQPPLPIEAFGLIGNWLVRADAGGGGENIVLDATVVNARGPRHSVNLEWSPADGGTINVLRNGAVVATVVDDGQFKNKLFTHTGTFTYQVCETDSGDCSNEVTVDVP